MNRRARAALASAARTRSGATGRRTRLIATLALALAIDATSARAGGFDTPGAADPEPAHFLAPLSPAIVEYRWRLVVPEWVVTSRLASARVYAPQWRAARVSYAVPEFRSERHRIGSVPEFSCKYADFGLPNECRTTWRAVYVDVPVARMQSDYLEFDVPRWSWQRWETPVDTPRLVWRESTMIVSVPALVSTRAP